MKKPDGPTPPVRLHVDEDGNQAVAPTPAIMKVWHHVRIGRRRPMRSEQFRVDARAQLRALKGDRKKLDKEIEALEIYIGTLSAGNGRKPLRQPKPGSKVALVLEYLSNPKVKEGATVVVLLRWLKSKGQATSDPHYVRNLKQSMRTWPDLIELDGEKVKLLP